VSSSKEKKGRNSHPKGREMRRGNGFCPVERRGFWPREKRPFLAYREYVQGLTKKEGE